MEVSWFGRYKVVNKKVWINIFTTCYCRNYELRYSWQNEKGTDETDTWARLGVMNYTPTYITHELTVQFKDDGTFRTRRRENTSVFWWTDRKVGW